MARTNPHDEAVLIILQQVVDAVQELLNLPNALEIWQKRVLEWSKNNSDPMKLRERITTKDGRIVSPLEPDLAEVHITPAGNLIPLLEILTREQKYAVLAAVNDHMAERLVGVKKIEPENSSLEWSAFTVVKVRVEMTRITEAEGRMLLKLADDVRYEFLLTAPTGSAAAPTSTRASHSKGDADAEPTTKSDAMRRVVGFYTCGVADEKMRQAELVIEDRQLSANDKIEQLNRLIPFNPTMTAEQIGQLIGVKRQAVANTKWWKENRKGQKHKQVEKRAIIQQTRSIQHGYSNPSGQRVLRNQSLDIEAE